MGPQHGDKNKVHFQAAPNLPRQWPQSQDAAEGGTDSLGGGRWAACGGEGGREVPLTPGSSSLSSPLWLPLPLHGPRGVGAAPAPERPAQGGLTEGPHSLEHTWGVG